MSTFAAVMTGKGASAISCIQLIGPEAGRLAGKIFVPADQNKKAWKVGDIILGNIVDQGRVIDQIVLGCEGEDNYVLNCHGNAIINEMVMQLLKKNGAKLIIVEEMSAKLLAGCSTIEKEAKLVQVKALTFEGAKIIANQFAGGLTECAENWLKELERSEQRLANIKVETEEVLAKSRVAGFIIHGCKAVIAGPPNSGKSTLLNYLAGRQKSIVADIEGTTRDWVEARCLLGAVMVQFFDTAGLEDKLTDVIDAQSRQRAIELVKAAELVLLVVDMSKGQDKLDESLPGKIGDKRVITVLNKSDLGRKFDIAKLPENLRCNVEISAKSGAGIEKLIERIQYTIGVAGFDLKRAVCFTDRQAKLLNRLSEAGNVERAKAIITELLTGEISL